MPFNATYNESYDLMDNYSHINNTLYTYLFIESIVH